MKNSSIPETLEAMRHFYHTGNSFEPEFRKTMLRKLAEGIHRHEEELCDALFKDLGKSSFESYSTEIGIVLNEIDYHLKNLQKWSRPLKKTMPFIFWPSRSKVLREPYGTVLIISPWNYPFQLLMNPLVGAISAGNCVALKTSPNAPATAKIMDRIIRENFPAEYISIFHGHKEVNQELLAQKWDYIFFTGSPKMGKIVMESASANLTPVTLELGGKSPCIIDESADLRLSARRTVWGKTINCGQTCIAPDYLLVHSRIKDAFVSELKRSITEMFGSDPRKSPDYPRIVSDSAMERIAGYLKEGKIVIGGKYDPEARYMEPTVMENISEEASVLKEEIFGPVFPLIEFTDTDFVIRYINDRPKPLALYLFTKNRKQRDKIVRETSSGGVCINDTLLHFVNHKIPFGGVGNSGMGRYHGKYSFDTFTHDKSVVYSTFAIDLKVKYPPYKGKLKRYKKFL